MPFELKTMLWAGTAAGALCAGMTANAQTTEPTSADETDTIIVTGTRIARDPNDVAPVPIQSVDNEDIRISGEFSLSDVVNDIPALLTSTTSEQSIDTDGQGGAAAALGTNVLNLRGLGAERTLTLIDGRRSVAGVEGSAAVDIGSLPSILVERVEVLTGGASAIYGADAVTGVVNFILRDDFEGFEVTSTLGANEDFNGEQGSIEAIFGRNFFDDRLNVTLAAGYRSDTGLKFNEQDVISQGGPFSASTEYANPDLRFQQGEITAAATPNLARFYDFENTGLFPYGLRIPSTDNFLSDFEAEFGSAPTLTPAEQALFTRGATALARTVIDQPVFSITSGRGFIIPGNPFTFDGFSATTGIDTDGNGVDDCLDSFVGYNSTFAPGAFGVIGGCYTVNADGSLRPVQDGTITGNANGGGGDSVFEESNNYLLPPEERLTFHLDTSFDLTDEHELFGSFSYSDQEVREHQANTTFWDLLFGAPDNPFLPAQLQDLAQETGGIAITIDPTIFGRSEDVVERRTLRATAGIKGVFADDYTYEVSGTLGEFKRTSILDKRVITDRFLAAIDAVVDPATGQATCRSTLDPTAVPPTTPFNIPVSDSGIFSFTPGAGSPCVPLNIWAAESGVTQEAIDFVTTTERNERLIQQYVFSAVVSGDTERFLSLPAGPIGFAAGAEYREERSKVTFDPLREGILPEGSPNAGQNVDTVSDNESLLFRPALDLNSTFAADAQYDVAEIFLEVSIPVLADMPFAQNLTVDGAIRLSDYSTVGTTTTWQAGASWTPIEDIRFRGTYSEAVRAPNIGELFAPENGTTHRPFDPCDVANVSAAGAPARRLENCVADLQAIGVNPFDEDGDYVFADPLTAAFGGITSGNTELTEETSTSYTLGFVAAPRFVPGLTVTVDYWNYEITEAIRSVDEDIITRTCYDSSSLDNEFCAAFSRQDDPGSAQFGGFNFIRVQPINFAAFEAAGFDAAATYGFDVGPHDFAFDLVATKYDKFEQFPDPGDAAFVDPELTEIGFPEYTLLGSATYGFENLSVTWQTQYLSEQLEAEVEVEELDNLFGPIGVAGDFIRHDLTAQLEIDDRLTLFGGINNLTEEEPFRTRIAYPVSPRGRFLFVGATLAFD